LPVLGLFRTRRQAAAELRVQLLAQACNQQDAANRNLTKSSTPAMNLEPTTHPTCILNLPKTDMLFNCHRLIDRAG
jgi:hypothetical protein